MREVLSAIPFVCLHHCARYSVLDNVVPGYYHRRHEDGTLCDSTCCNNTAPEHAMCGRLITDDITRWAKNYKDRRLQVRSVRVLEKSCVLAQAVVLQGSCPWGC